MKTMLIQSMCLSNELPPLRAPPAGLEHLHCSAPPPFTCSFSDKICDVISVINLFFFPFAPRSSICILFLPCICIVSILSRNMQYCLPVSACVCFSYGHLKTVDGVHPRDHDAARLLPFAADDLVHSSLLKARVRL